MLRAPLGTGVKKEVPVKRDSKGRYVGGASPIVFQKP